MKKFGFLAGILLSLVFTLVCINNSEAIEINLYVDGAPNVYGSPDWAAWKTNADSSAADGTFINMENSLTPANSGTNNFEIDDSVVYSFGDLGRRLHFIYWVPDATIAELQAASFEISIFYEWDGVTYDYYGDYGWGTWVEPGSWEEYNGGVVGSGGFAWWGAYGYNADTPEANAVLAADIAEWDNYQGDVRFYARTAGGPSTMITANHTPVPEPSTFILLGLGAAGLILYRKKRKTS
ncbi:hypothetical protein MNBD_DELTA02-1217 [hydrothermal vent metagenome]|uniref:Ice-binding protein C-terminal domain-containing protein n=1 Tax=hydrothermal vent metagenome TaxID=652676 RepID=A0A3B0V3K2_9ZZZZ